MCDSSPHIGLSIDESNPKDVTTNGSLDLVWFANGDLRPTAGQVTKVTAV